MSNHGNNSDFPNDYEEDEIFKSRKKLLEQFGGIDKNLQDSIETQWPEGIIRPDDDGETVFAIGVQSGKIILQFPNPTKWIGFTPDQAMEIAQLLIKKNKKTGITKPFSLEL